MKHGDTPKVTPVATYTSPGSFLSRLDTSIFEQATVTEIRTLLFRAIGTLDEVFTIPAIELSPDQLVTLDLAASAMN